MEKVWKAVQDGVEKQELEGKEQEGDERTGEEPESNEEKKGEVYEVYDLHLINS